MNESITTEISAVVQYLQSLYDNEVILDTRVARLYALRNKIEKALTEIGGLALVNEVDEAIADLVSTRVLITLNEQSIMNGIARIDLLARVGKVENGQG